ncbi:hypothetical protein [Streptomyces sp. NPDC058656]|uniref:hypothetical protein n=1 Tax=unclassified Streptomyces TaxID=2593676 RepID=UPI00365A05FB
MRFVLVPVRRTERIPLTHAGIEKGLHVNQKYKVIILVTVAVLTMAALIYVNLQNVRDTAEAGRTTQAGF